MDFAVVVIVFLLFGAGFVIAFQGFVGGEIRSEGRAFGFPTDLEHAGMAPEVDRHPWRLVASGFGLMAGAVGLGILLL